MESLPSRQSELVKSMAAESMAKIKEQDIKIELQMYGFAAVKEIAKLRGIREGTMECPMCGQSLQFSIAGSRKHLHARCSREGCINAME